MEYCLNWWLVGCLFHMHLCSWFVNKFYVHSFCHLSTFGLKVKKICGGPMDSQILRVISAHMNKHCWKKNQAPKLLSISHNGLSCFWKFVIFIKSKRKCHNKIFKSYSKKIPKQKNLTIKNKIKKQKKIKYSKQKRAEKCYTTASVTMVNEIFHSFLFFWLWKERSLCSTAPSHTQLNGRSDVSQTHTEANRSVRSIDTNIGSATSKMVGIE